MLLNPCVVLHISSVAGEVSTNRELSTCLMVLDKPKSGKMFVMATTGPIITFMKGTQFFLCLLSREAQQLYTCGESLCRPVLVRRCLI